MKKVWIIIQVPEDFRQRVKQSALDQKKTMTSWVIKAIDNEFKRIEK